MWCFTRPLTFHVPNLLFLTVTRKWSASVTVKLWPKAEWRVVLGPKEHCNPAFWNQNPIAFNYLYGTFSYLVSYDTLDDECSLLNIPVFSNFWSIYATLSEEHTTYSLILFKIMTLCFCAPIKWSLPAKHFIPRKIHSYLPGSLRNFVNSVQFNQWFEFPTFCIFYCK